ncbi:MAG: NAD(P)-dependent oxidoreductase [Nibricoccus sp.]
MFLECSRTTSIRRKRSPRRSTIYPRYNFLPPTSRAICAAFLCAITGAAGNLGSLLSRHLLANSQHDLRLLIHNREVPPDLREQARAPSFRCDLANPESFSPALAGADCVVHFAGVLFQANPERFLPITNTQYFTNLLETAIANKVRRIILISFPHVEGESTPEKPATGKLDGAPSSAHARTRLEEEKLLFEAGQRDGLEAVSLRVGMVYGRGILMIDAARWLAQRHLFGVWKNPTWIHLISTDDFLAATAVAATNHGIQGIYHLGDEGRQTLQEFLDLACSVWNTRRPWRLPLGVIYFAAQICEWASQLLHTRSALTRDFITIGRCSYYGDTHRMRTELLPKLKHPTLKDGLHTL